VIFRAELAEQAVVKTVPGADVVTVSGVPEGDATGYHSPNPKWKETPPEQWGLDFKSQLFGRSLVISTDHEIFYVHHYYHLCDLELVVPDSIKIVKQRRELSGNHQPDLSTPDVSGPPAGAKPAFELTPSPPTATSGTPVL
jgi:hypothetical protein